MWTLNTYKIGNFGRVLVGFASSQIISNFLRLLSGLLVTRAIDPELYGQYSGAAIYLGYILLGQGGIINGLSRELPFELGKGNDDYARKLASSVFSYSFILSLLAGIAYMAISVFNFWNSKYLLGVIYLSYSIIAGLYLLNKQFLPVLYRTNKDFASISQQNIKLGIANLGSVLLVTYFSIYGLIFRGIFLACFEFFLLFKNKPYKINLTYDFKDYIKLFKTGLPIFMVGQINPLWSTIINNLIFSLGGALNYGLYAVCSVVQGAIGIIPVSFGSIMYPRMTIMYGQGKSIHEIINANIKPLIFQFLILLFITITSSVLLPIVIPFLLPKYIGGIQAAQWMAFVPLVQSFGAITNIFNVVKKQKWYLISYLIGAILGSIYILCMLYIYEFNLIYFPQGLILGQGIQQIMSLVFIKKLYQLK